MSASRIDVSQESISAREIRSNTHTLKLTLMDVNPCIIGDYMVTLELGVVYMRSTGSIKIRLGSMGLLFELVDGDNAIEILHYNSFDSLELVTVRGWGSYQAIIDTNDISASTARVLDVYTQYMAPILATAARCILIKQRRLVTE